MRFILGALTGLVVLTTGAVAYAVLNPLPSARIAAQQAVPAEPDPTPDSAAAAMPDDAADTAQADPAPEPERPALAIASMADPVTRLSTADHPAELDQAAEMPEMPEMADEATVAPEAPEAIDMAALVAPVETPGDLPATEAPEIASEIDPEIAGNTPAVAETPVHDETLMTDETGVTDDTVIAEAQPDPADGPRLEAPEEIAGLEFTDPDLAAPPMLRPTAWLAPLSEEAPLPPAADTLPPSGADLVYVTGNRVNMRSGPGSRHDWIATLSRGTGLVLIEKQGRWFKVQADVDGETVTGWMAAGYLSSQPVGT